MPLEKNAVTEKENQWSYTLYSTLQTWSINTYININIINIYSNISMKYLHQPNSHHTSLMSRTLFLNYKGRQCLDLGQIKALLPVSCFQLKNVSPISRKGVASSLIWLYKRVYLRSFQIFASFFVGRWNQWCRTLLLHHGHFLEIQTG